MKTTWKRILALMLCLAFAAVLMTGCGGGDEEPPESTVTPNNSEELDLSGDLAGTFWHGPEGCITFDGNGMAVINYYYETDPTNSGPFTWNGEVGTVEGDRFFATFFIEDDTMQVMDDRDHRLQLTKDSSYIPTDDALTTIQATTWVRDELEYTFHTDGSFTAYNSYSDMTFEGSYNWDAMEASGMISMDGDEQLFLFEDGCVVVVDDEDTHYPMDPGTPTGNAGGLGDDGRDPNEGGLGDDGRGQNEYHFYFHNISVSFFGDGSVLFFDAETGSTMEGTLEWGAGESGYVHTENGSDMYFEFVGNDFYMEDAGGELLQMDSYPSPEYFDPEQYSELYEHTPGEFDQQIEELAGSWLRSDEFDYIYVMDGGTGECYYDDGSVYVAGTVTTGGENIYYFDFPEAGVTWSGYLDNEGALYIEDLGYYYDYVGAAPDVN